ncbi:hypothetical protein HER32_00190 [Hymenobacter sp. BT18]|uniref:hypothetical protein n=1 Tax=Hymenobacter sp. BT18 TaxID=2835648 RepID=UPI00143E9B70|nr:hypothetical protein [Hymenobacter sp. BT18]QIX59694.1 hypothetical protein HER32_00190 [Hymenobacter sp. BT18]
MYNDPTATASIEEAPLTYEQQRARLAAKELEYWPEFVSGSFTQHTNFINETVVQGTVSSTASVATFKDIVLEVTFYSKTDTELGTRRATIYEFLPPGGSVHVKKKFATPANTHHVQYGIADTQSVVQ